MIINFAKCGFHCGHVCWKLSKKLLCNQFMKAEQEEHFYSNFVFWINFSLEVGLDRYIHGYQPKYWHISAKIPAIDQILANMKISVSVLLAIMLLQIQRNQYQNNYRLGEYIGIGWTHIGPTWLINNNNFQFKNYIKVELNLYEEDCEKLEILLLSSLFNLKRNRH